MLILISYSLISILLSTFNISTLNSFWRLLLAALAPDLRAWDMQEAEVFDTARTGQDPAMHMLVRNLQTSIGISDGLEHVGVFWDIEAYFESCSPEVMLKAAVSEELPLSPAALALWGYAQQRRLRLNDTYHATNMLPKRSIATGCHSATRVARAILAKPVRASTYATPSLLLTLHVDDFAQEAVATREEVII